MSSNAALFKPLKVGAITLEHRVAMAPLTRFRATSGHVHTPMATEYYKQRASTPGTLLITEATFIRPEAGGYDFVPGIWSSQQIKAWKEIVDAIHAQGSFIYLQLWALGRAATGSVITSAGYRVVSASDVPLDAGGDTRGKDIPTPLTTAEVEEYVKWYAQAARNFVQGAGGDGVEVHGANGYLIDQFTQKNSNKRTDKYGGSVENRTRFGREVVKAVTQAIGADRTGIRFSPHSNFQGMKMSKEDMEETFSYFVNQLKDTHPDLAYIHVTEPRVGGGSDQLSSAEENIEFLHKIWAPRPIIVAGTYTAETAFAESAKRSNCVIAMGRYFISNPDLPERIRKNISFTPYNRKTFYLPGPTKTEGYTDYPAAAASKL